MPKQGTGSIRIVGSFALGIGMILLFLTALTVLFVLFTGGSSDLGQFVRGAAAVATAVIMAVTLIACGERLQRRGIYTSYDFEAIRYAWAALVVVMAVGTIANFWLVPPLSGIAALMLVALFAIRGDIIRLTRP